jgi:hypothetical protein
MFIYTSLVLHSLMYIWYYIERLTNRYLDDISKSSHIKLVSTSPINKANIKIKIKIKANHEFFLNDVLYSYQLHKKVK